MTILYAIGAVIALGLFVWGVQHRSDVQYLRVYAGELRKKLEADPAQPRFIITEPGIGYRLIEAE